MEQEEWARLAETTHDMGLLDNMSRHRDEAVLLAVLDNPYSTPEMLQRLASSKNPVVAERARDLIANPPSL